MFTIELKEEGLEEMAIFLKQCSRIADTYSGVKLSPVDRTDGSANNAEILNYLNKSGRAFNEPTSEDLARMSTAAVNEWDRRNIQLLRRLKAQAKKRARANAKASGLTGKALTSIGNAAADAVTSATQDEQWARQTQAAMLTKAMEAYMQSVSGNIDEQKAPGGLTKLSPGYEAQKIKKFGFDTPIGKATGQLLENLDTAISGKNIRLIRK